MEDDMAHGFRSSTLAARCNSVASAEVQVEGNSSACIIDDLLHAVDIKPGLHSTHPARETNVNRRYPSFRFEEANMARPIGAGHSPEALRLHLIQSDRNGYGIAAVGGQAVPHPGSKGRVDLPGTSKIHPHVLAAILVRANAC